MGPMLANNDPPDFSGDVPQGTVEMEEQVVRTALVSMFDSVLFFSNAEVGGMQQLGAGFSRIGIEPGFWSKVGSVSKRVGIGMTGIGIAVDTLKWKTGRMRGWHFATNQVATAIGFAGGWGLAFNTVYTAGDVFIPGGYEGQADRLELGFWCAERDVWRAYGALP